MARGVQSGFKRTYPGANPPGGAVTSVNTRTGAVVLVKADVGLGSVDNTADATKNAAAAVLTNKDLTSGTNTFPTLNQNTTGSAAKLTTGRTIAVTGDLTYTSPSFDGSGNVSGTGTLATVNANVGAFGDATHVPQVTFDGKGRATGVVSVAITGLAESAVTGLVSDLAAKATDSLVVHLAGTETISGPKVFSLGPTISTPETWATSTTPSTPAAGFIKPFFDANGLPSFVNPAGVVIPFSIGDTSTALHSNADFETISAGVPTIWGTFWQQGATFASITTDVIAGSKAASVTWAAASGNHMILETDTFTVIAGDTVTCSIYSKKTVGSPGISIQFLSKVSGTPDYFDGATTLQPGPTQTLTGSYVKYTQSFVVPVGHTIARIGYSYTPAAAEACTIQCDLSASARTGSNAATTLPGNSWVKEACRAATTANVTVAGSAPSTVDGTALALNDRVLVWQQSTASQNGIYYVTTLGTGANGTWARAADATTSAQLAAAQVAVVTGTAYGGGLFLTSWRATDTLSTTAMTWSQDSIGDSWQVACTSTVTASSTTNVTITGMSQAVTTPATSAVYLIRIAAELFISTTSSSAIVELLVDGAAQTVQLTQASGTVTTLGMQYQEWRVTGLSAGAHTFTARLRTDAAGHSAQVIQTNSTMTVERKA